MPCWIQIAICWCRGYKHLSLQFIRNKDRLFPEGRNVKFGLCLQEWKLAMQSRLFKNAAAGDALWISGTIFLYLLVYFLYSCGYRPKSGGSHGEISIAAVELCSLFTICCKTALNVRFYCLALSGKQRGIWAAILNSDFQHIYGFVEILVWISCCVWTESEDRVERQTLTKTRHHMIFTTFHHQVTKYQN